jgi:catechol 2,3-dioxygenase-like lactoylglutathione lyase family enzyme
MSRPSIAAISIYVNELDEAIDFYVNVLGFTVTERHGALFARLSHDAIPLLLCASNYERAPFAAGVTGVVLGIEIADAERWAGELRRKGVPIIAAPLSSADADRYVSIRDPSGNVIEFFQLRAEARPVELSQTDR